MPLRGPKQSGHRPVIRRNMGYGKWFGWGKQSEDAVSGWVFPERLMVRQRGGLVSRRLEDGSIDFPKEW